MVMERKKEDRSLLIYILLSIITCGIYALYFNYCMCNDINAVCAPKEQDDANRSPNFIVVWLLSIITCGIYYYVWLYKQGNRIQRVGHEYGIEVDESGTTLLLWWIVGVLLFGIGPLVSIYFLIKNVNRLCARYNREYVDGAGSNSQPPQPASEPAPKQVPATEPKQGPVQAAPAQLQENGRTVSMAASPANRAVQQPVAVPAMGGLVWIRGEYENNEIPLRSGEALVFGRDPAQCSIVLSAADISRKHCAIEFSAADNCYYITDYSSLGVAVDGEKLPKEARVGCAPGSEVALGSGSNRFRLK